MGLFSSIFNKNNKKKDNQMKFNIEEFVDDLIQKSDLYEIGDMNIGIEEEKKEALTPHNQSNYQLPPLELLDKPEKRIVDNLDIDYVGFTIPDYFVFGYGLDVDEKYRNLPSIYYFPKE